MTSPIPESSREACREALPGLLRAHGFDPDTPVVEDRDGWVNPCYFVGSDVVVRFNSRDPDVPKFRREYLAFELCREAGLPVPDVIAYDISLRYAPFEALLVERLPGGSIESSWPDLSERSRDALARAAGELMAALHDLEPPRWGDLGADEDSASWLEFVAREFDRVASAALLDGCLVRDDIERMRGLLTERLPAVARVDTPSLVHRDLHLGNLLHVGDRITGLLDFEWGLSGDPEWDVLIGETTADICAGSWPPRLAAYRALRPADDDAQARREAYALLHNIDFCTVTKLHFPNEHEQTVAATRAYARRLSDR